MSPDRTDRDRAPLVHAWILHYNSLEDTQACVASLKKATYPNLKVTVVDNGSPDGSGKLLNDALPGISILLQSSNVGFAAGNNLALRVLQQEEVEYLLLLNNDTIVSPDFLEPLVDVLERHPEAAAASGAICFHPDTDRLWYGGGRIAAWRGKSIHLLHNKDVRLLDAQTVQSVSFLSGCLMLLRWDDVRTHGLFDERFFMYFEDAELCRRLTNRGRRLLFEPKSRIYHKVRFEGNSPRSVYFGVRNQLLFVELGSSGWRRWLVIATVLVIITSRIIVRWSFRPDLLRAAIAGVMDYIRRRFREGRGLSRYL